jgi:hypothetical protein
MGIVHEIWLCLVAVCKLTSAGQLCPVNISARFGSNEIKVIYLVDAIEDKLMHYNSMLIANIWQ